MDPFEATKVVHERILKLEPETIARKIVGYVYLQENPDQEMIRLALGPDNLIQNLVERAKAALHLVPTPVISPPISPSIRYARIPSLSPRQRVLPPRLARYWNHQLVFEQQQMDNLNLIGSPPEDYRFRDQFMGPEDQIEPLNSGASGVMNNYYMQSALEGPVKTCHYFIKGFCKHGNNCRYSHGQSFLENYPHMFEPNLSELGNEDQVFSPGQLERLEMEITELLKSRGGSPISIASLPLLYYENYGRTLRAEGYLAESKRHGKVGFSLTKLLACLRNSIRLIDRPHGQHAVILAEDAPNYMGSQGERHDPGTNFSSMHQIYLTFPAESAFSEEDVSNYFSTFGPVQDVRIPCQQRRMFGFVTFVSSDTVKIILAKGNPHFVCGARVLVKPYREKSKLFERKYHEKLDQSTFTPSLHMVTDTELQARAIREQLIEEHRKALEHEMRRFEKLELTRRYLSNQSSIGYSMDEPKVSEDPVKFPSEQFNYLLNVLNSVPTTDNTDQESNQGVDLPDSPFASVVASSIAAII